MTQGDRITTRLCVRTGVVISSVLAFVAPWGSAKFMTDKAIYGNIQLTGRFVTVQGSAAQKKEIDPRLLSVFSLY